MNGHNFWIKGQINPTDGTDHLQLAIDGFPSIDRKLASMVEIHICNVGHIFVVERAPLDRVY